MLQDEDEVFSQVKHNVISLFDKDVETQALLHTRHRLRRQIEYMIDRKLDTIEELAQHIETLTEGIDTKEMYENICGEFRNYVMREDYPSILKVYNQKGMLPQSQGYPIMRLANKEKYLSFVLSILKEGKNDAACILLCYPALFWNSLSFKYYDERLG